MNWNEYFLGIAQYVSSKSKDPSTKVGAVIVDATHKVLSIGYNGFPRGIADTPERLNDRATKYRYIVHADANAILNACGPVVGATIYVWPFPPCSECAKLIIQSGIARVICPKASPELEERWKDSLSLSREMFKEAGVNLVEVDI